MSREFETGQAEAAQKAALNGRCCAPTPSMECGLSFICNPYTGRKDRPALNQWVTRLEEEVRTLTTKQFGQAQQATIERIGSLAEAHGGQIPNSKVAHVLELQRLLWIGELPLRR